MTHDEQVNLFYLSFSVLVLAIFVWRYQVKQKKNFQTLEYNRQSGLTEPSSLHPKIDGGVCIGAGACVSACPEGDVIGLIGGKAVLLNPTLCIGHGVCKSSCPVDAISLVFGTEKRGVEIPDVDVNYQTNMPGIYIAGELGGMGLIRNSLEQGKQAMYAIAKTIRSSSSKQLDVIIIGAGPAGLAASLGAKEKNLNYLTIEQDSLGGTVAHFPRGKIVMTSPVTIPIVGKLQFKETTKEILIQFWEKAVSQTKLNIQYKERMEDIQRIGESYQVRTNISTYETKNILLALGRRGTPRKLGVKGEDKCKVVYRLIDNNQYKNKHVLVVGGGDSAIEAAVSLSETEGCVTTLCYRGDAFSRIKQKNREKVSAASDSGRLKVLMKTVIDEILDDSVNLKIKSGEVISIPNDNIIVCAGGLPPTPFLKNIGIQIETKYGTE